MTLMPLMELQKCQGLPGGSLKHPILALLQYKTLGAPCKKTLLPLMELKKCWGLLSLWTVNDCGNGHFIKKPPQFLYTITKLLSGQLSLSLCIFQWISTAISVAPQRHKNHFQGAPNSLFLRIVSVLDVWEAPVIVREPPTIVGIGSPHHFFREPPTFLQLRLLLLFDFRKPPSFLQGAPNIL